MNSSSNTPTLGDHFIRRQEPGRAGLRTLSVTIHDGLVHRNELERRTESALAPEQHLLVRKGDIAYNMMRMWQGACGLAETDAIISPAYVVLTPKGSIDSRFAVHWFKSPRMLHLLWAYSHGLTEDRLRLYFDDFCQIPAMPPPLDEQHRIMAVLNAWDRAIGFTVRLIAEKRRRFSGLLRALAGSANDRWKHGCLGDLIASISSGVSVNSSDRLCCDGEIGVLKTSSVLTGIFRPQEHKVVVVSEISRVREPIVADTIIVSRMNTPDLVGASAYVPTSIPYLFLPDRLWKICPRRNVSARWLAYVIGSPEIRTKVKYIVSGTSNSMKNISQDGFLQLPILIPPLRDQNNLARMLNAAERDLILTENCFSKFEIAKRGLMQKLLIGEWRLDERFDNAVLAPPTFRTPLLPTGREGRVRGAIPVQEAPQ